ncbi:ABC transporter substrate-binding protein [Pseudarthrobacter phenanthrenivorans]|uniref:ABC transporter substrate-binding protein n=2 Tax=Pseudarthrobacter phenanthrenivorans TaxID=361575 RepID=A0A3B0FV11_PSEPS|nr:ABC transporter substrate-binding protein [Pseudarthrobacter phenanthrenivorans]TPV50719.1 ABC transporter substrate-binding protein [Pseudarthrobacter phenanthrenivorans]
MMFGATAPASAAPPAPAPAAAANAADVANVTATINETIDGVGSFTGSFVPTGFGTENGDLTVTGLVEGTFTSVDGVVTPISQTVTTTVDAGTSNAACDIINLDLGPLNLNVLGLVVDLSQVQLDITAVPGAGNLLGNLLCSVAGLLDGNGTSGLANLLNRALGL